MEKTRKTLIPKARKIIVLSPNGDLQPTAAIYNRWLFTLGGGEQVTFAYAEALRDLGYKTVLITHKAVDTQAAQTKMNVDLDGIDIKYIPLSECEQLSAYSEHYDVFINTSYLDYFPNRSKNGILSIFFPGEVYLSLWEFIKRGFVLPSFKNFFIYPTQFENFSHDEYKKNGIIYKWIENESSISFNSNAINKLEIELFLPTFAFSVVESLMFLINDTHVEAVSRTHHHAKNTITFSFCSKQPIKKITIKNSFSATYPLALVALTIPNARYILYNYYKLLFPKWEMRLHGGPGVTTLSDLQSYKKIITISEFCRYWITKYWGLDSDVLYPPVNVEAFSPAKKKKKWITHIGRFFVTGHSKKQLELIRVFKDLTDSRELAGWELHLVGTVHGGESHQKYYEACVSEAKGYPIIFHIGAPFSELKSVLSQSSLYWHATGLDENPNKQPILMEHFGITTVEAMAAGCVPVVIGAGGQPEIVTSNCGYIWKTRSELKLFTLDLVRNTEKREAFSRNAIQRSKYFSREKFKQRFQVLLNK